MLLVLHTFHADAMRNDSFQPEINQPKLGICDENQRRSPSAAPISIFPPDLMRCPHYDRNFSVPVLFKQDKQAWQRTGWHAMKETTLRPHVPDTLKAAVCLTGATRTLPDQEMRTSFKRNVIDRLNADLFMVVHADSSKERHGLSAIHSEDDLERTLKYLEPKRVEITKGRRLSISFNPHPQNCIPQLLNHKKCAHMVKKAEKEEMFEYDWILSTRPDLHWLEPFPMLGLFPTRTMWALMSVSHNLASVHKKDMAMLIPRHLVDSVMLEPHSGCRTKDHFTVPESQVVRTYCGYEPKGGCECELAKCFGLLRVQYGWFHSNVTINRDDSAEVSSQQTMILQLPNHIASISNTTGVNAPYVIANKT